MIRPLYSPSPADVRNDLALQMRSQQPKKTAIFNLHHRPISAGSPRKLSAYTDFCSSLTSDPSMDRGPSTSPIWQSQLSLIHTCSKF